NYLWLSWYDLKLKQITLGIINDNLVNSSADLSIQLTSLNLPINLKKPEAYQSFQFLMAEQAKQFQSDIEKAINTTGTDTLPKTK
ncbi:MAG: hypothetical protein WCL61_00745, partial [bacterium]